MTAYRIEEVASRELLAEFLQRAPIRFAYPLGYLDANYVEHCRWFAALAEAETQALVLLYSGLARPGLFTAGDAAGVASILSSVADQLPAAATGHIAAEHLAELRKVCRMDGEIKAMSRMGLAREDFHDARHDLLSDTEVVQLGHRDTAAIMRLYQLWPDHFFEPFQLETGLYFGIRDSEGGLACIAGTHNISSTYDIASIGNLVTHPEHRRHGYARLCTARLLREAFQRVRRVTLDVQHRNEPAIRTYQHFGFRHFSDFYETHLVFPQGLEDE